MWFKVSFVFWTVTAVWTLHWLGYVVLACLVSSGLFLKSLPHFGNAQRCFAQCWYVTLRVLSSLEKLKLSPHFVHWSCFSLWEYLWRAREIGLLNALLHTGQYTIPCTVWWWYTSSWALFTPVLHILHLYFRVFWGLHRVWLSAVKDLKVGVPLLLEGFVTSLDH